MNAEPITQEQLEKGFKMLIATFMKAGYTKDEAMKLATEALANGDFEDMVKTALMEACTVKQ